MRGILFIGIFFVIGCVHTAVVDDAEGSKFLNSVTMGCKKPYAFTQDCSVWNGATRKLNIEGFDVVVAGTEDGSTILVMDADIYKNVLIEDIFFLNNPTHSKASNNSYFAVKKILKQQSISVQKAIPIGFLGNIDGYVLELDGDGYKTLIKYTVK